MSSAPTPSRKDTSSTKILRPVATLALLFGLTWLTSLTSTGTFEGGRLAILVGFVLLAASAAGALAGATGLPRLTGFILVGILAGPSLFGIIPISAVEDLGARVSMDGKGRWMDNVLIERLWRSVKHEWVLLHEYNTIPELEVLLGEWIERYNTWRPHTANGGEKPWQAYRGLLSKLEREEVKGGPSNC